MELIYLFAFILSGFQINKYFFLKKIISNKKVGLSISNKNKKDFILRVCLGLFIPFFSFIIIKYTNNDLYWHIELSLIFFLIYYSFLLFFFSLAHFFFIDKKNFSSKNINLSTLFIWHFSSLLLILGPFLSSFAIYFEIPDKYFLIIGQLIMIFSLASQILLIFFVMPNILNLADLKKVNSEDLRLFVIFEIFISVFFILLIMLYFIYDLT